VAEALEQGISAANLDNRAKVVRVGCMGLCEAAPLVLVSPDGIFYRNVDEHSARRIVNEHLANDRPVEDLELIWEDGDGAVSRSREIPFFARQLKIALRNCGVIDPLDIDEYIAADGYLALEKSLFEMQPEEILDIVHRSGLRGRGGAGFPAGLKWQLVRQAEGDVKYVVCNADEGDPGAFMDRSILEGDPHSVIEAMTVAGRAVGSGQGYVYLRAEYPLAIERLGGALEQARSRGLLGTRILGSDFSFDVEIRIGAGAFVCGEETALMHSIEGKRGTPRTRPPFPAQKGLWGKPTLLNNVETWANVPAIICRGADWYAGIGNERSKGTKVFALAGSVRNTGLVEVPMGISLAEVVDTIGGGMRLGRPFKAAQSGGPSGGCIPASLAKVAIDYESLQDLGAIMGSGGLIIMDEGTCMVNLAGFFLDFLSDESCGKCPPCRIGVRVLKNILDRITRGEGRIEDLETLKSLGEHIQKSSLCGLGQTAPNAVLSTVRHFRDEYEAHIKYKRCPAVVCKGIVSSPCQYSCPIEQDAPCYIGLIAQGKFEEAVEIVRRENPLPAVCGRVCDAPCEIRCRAGEGDGEAISIRALKRFLSDYEREKGLEVSPKTREKRGERVAIVGSGPAGLTCAHYLALEGYQVTIFESLPVVGGMLAVGIPEYRLPKDALEHDVSMIRKMGVEIRTNTTVGRDIHLSDLRKEYQAVFVAAGAHRGLALGIDGGGPAQVIDAVDFLREVNLGRSVDIGQRVVVIGGGNSAVDAASAAKRLGKDVRMLYRRTRQEMPALPEEVKALEEEEIKVEFLIAPLRAAPGSGGRMTGLECIRMRLADVDKSGRRRPVPIEGSEFTVECDTVISAIGQKPDVGTLLSGSDVNMTGWGTLAVDPETLCTGIEGVFAGGDVVTGPSAVTPAMAHGKIAARMIHAYLQGRPVGRQYNVIRPAIDVEVAELSEEEVETLRKPEMPLLSMDERTRTFKEVQLGLSTEMAIAEAKRCLRCDKG
jgi:NADH-quinone oxidoreductase subunit F